MVRSVTSLIMLLFVASLGSADEKKVRLETEIPEEELAGTPPAVLARLYPGLILPSKEKMSLLVPKGTTNLALKKKVSSSDQNPLLGELSYVTDGKKKPSEDGCVELDRTLQWIQIDLGKPAKIYGVYVWHFFREARSYHDVIVQVADNKEFTKNVRTVYNNDTDASAKKGVGRDRPYIETNLGMLINAKGVPARFVRLYSNGSTSDGLNHYIEVEVFGKPAS